MKILMIFWSPLIDDALFYFSVPSVLVFKKCTFDAETARCRLIMSHWSRHRSRTAVCESFSWLLIKTKYFSYSFYLLISFVECFRIQLEEKLSYAIQCSHNGATDEFSKVVRVMSGMTRRINSVEGTNSMNKQMDMKLQIQRKWIEFGSQRKEAVAHSQWLLFDLMSSHRRPYLWTHIEGQHIDGLLSRKSMMKTSWYKRRRHDSAQH